MDTLRGNFDASDYDDDQRDWDREEEPVREAPPAAIGTDERRMQVRAYNHWASLLNDKHFPSIEDLAPEELTDFGPYSVLLDFTAGVENPAIQYVGDQLAVECGTTDDIENLDDVPSRSLLSRITDHYMQILANQAPIGFEAEFVNQRGATILYRGILLPYSSNDQEIDFIYGVINWKEMADQLTTDELLLEIDQALAAEDDTARAPDPVTEWADGPAADAAASDILDLRAFETDPSAVDGEYPQPDFGPGSGGEAAGDAPLEEPERELQHPVEAIARPVLHGPTDHDDGDDDDTLAPALDEPLDEPVDEDEGLHDCLAAARELANAARSSEDRSRTALYAAVGRAYDFSLAAQEEPEDFDELVSENGLTVQERAPMTPVVKLVFGADYDKTRLTEYAAVLAHAHRMQVERGALSKYLSAAEGGLKGVVTAERRLRREEAGKPVETADAPREKIAKKLRAIGGQGFDSISAEGPEFGLVMIRRLATGEVVMLGEIADDVPLVERAARKLLG